MRSTSENYENSDSRVKINNVNFRKSMELCANSDDSLQNSKFTSELNLLLAIILSTTIKTSKQNKSRLSDTNSNQRNIKTKQQQITGTRNVFERAGIKNFEEFIKLLFGLLGRNVLSCFCSL